MTALERGGHDGLPVPWLGPACEQVGVRTNPKLPAVDAMMALLVDNYRLWRTGSEAVAEDWRSPGVALKLRGAGGLRQRINADLVLATGKAPSESALAQLLLTAEGLASRRPDIPKPQHRVMEHDGVSYLDLGRPDGLTGAVVAGRCWLEPRPPVLFARSALTDELPVPALGQGSMDEVRALINIADPDGWALWLACRVASLIPGIPHPVEIFTGQPGSGKTMAMRISMELMCPGGEVPRPKDEVQYEVLASGTYVMAMDNLSYVGSVLSDEMAKSSTGGTGSRRRLFSDDDLHRSKYRNVIMITGIELGSPRGDLNDRTVAHRFTRPAGKFISEDTIMTVWRQQHPAALAWLLEYTARVLAYLAQVPRDGSWSRMVRFAEIVQAVDAMAGTRAHDLWQSRREEMAEDLVQDHPVSVAIVKAVRAPFWDTASALRDLLIMHGGLQDQRGKPYTPAGIGRAVERVEQSLEAVGWRVTHSRAGKNRSKIIGLEPPGTWV